MVFGWSVSEEPTSESSSTGKFGVPRLGKWLRWGGGASDAGSDEGRTEGSQGAVKLVELSQMLQYLSQICIPNF